MEPPPIVPVTVHWCSEVPTPPFVTKVRPVVEPVSSNVMSPSTQPTRCQPVPLRPVPTTRPFTVESVIFSVMSPCRVSSPLSLRDALDWFGSIMNAPLNDEPVTVMSRSA